MRHLFVFAVIIVVLIIGLVVYTEVSHRKFVKDLPPVPIQKSIRQQNLPSPQLESEGQNLKQAAERFDATEDEALDLQTETVDSESHPPQEKTATSFNHKAASPQTPIPDWRNDDEFFQPPLRDPWHKEDTSMKFVDWNELSQEDQLSMSHKSLLREFGDIPQVRVIIAFDKRPKDLPLPIDEAIVHTEACLYLWPDNETAQSLTQLKQLKADGFKGFPGVR